MAFKLTNYLRARGLYDPPKRIKNDIKQKQLLHQLDTIFC